MLQSWDAFFRSSSAGALPGQAYQAPPSLAEPGRNQVSLSSLVPQMGMGGGVAMGGQVSEKIIDDHLAVQAIIRSYQVRSSAVSEMSLGTAVLSDLFCLDFHRKVYLLITIVVEGQCY